MVVISPTGITVCPKTHRLVYIKLANINDNLSNHIFQSVVKTKSGCKLQKSRKLSYTRAREILLGKMEKVGLPKGSFGLHNLRSGEATVAGNIVPERLIQKHGSWKAESSKTGTYTSFISENVGNKYDKRIHLYFHLWLQIAFWLPVLYCRSAGCWHILYSC